MPKRTLTDRALNALRPAPAGKRDVIMDAVVPGFGVRVTDKGTKTFILVARFGGSPNPTRRALGEYGGALDLAGARAKARQWLELVAKGIDPQADKDRKVQEAARRQKNSFAAVCEDFIRRDVTKKRRGADMARELRQEFVTRWGERPITEITQHDILAVLDDAIDRGAPNQAHALFGHVRRLFNWAIGRGSYGIERSPCDRLKPKDAIGSRTKRTRTLNDDELRALWRASARLDYPFGPMLRLLCLTGLRRGEVADARWREFDLTKALWTIPAERMKSGIAHVVPLVPDALAILESLPRFDAGDYLFSTTFGRRPISGFSKMKTRLDKKMLRTWRALGRIDGKDRRAAAPEAWTVHDIRRSMRTHLSALPVTDLVRELVIAHARPGLHQVYDQFGYVDEKRRALELWTARLLGIVEPPPSNVVRLRNAIG